MAKQILIVGGGISGLAVLHHLKAKYGHRKDVQIKLFEKSDSLGGTIKTIHRDGFFFETGPNGFLSSKPSTLEFVSELGLEGSLLEASSEAEERFILSDNTLFKIPLSPMDFLGFRPLSAAQKLRMLGEIFVAKGKNPDETVFEFGQRRLGQKFAELFLDPMVAGVFAGDARQLNLRFAFPRIYEIEQTYGSLFKGMICLARQKKPAKGERRINVAPKGRLTSFNKGMGELIEALGVKYKDSITLGQEVESLSRANNRFVVETNSGEQSFDEVFLCAPAYSAAKIVWGFNKKLAEDLRRINYASIAVVGLVYNRSAFDKPPRGFGYLIPSNEKKEVLGALFSSNIFPNRSDNNHILVQVMIGGARNPESINRGQDELIKMAQDEVSSILKAHVLPQQTFFAAWPMGIPQYDMNYASLITSITNELSVVRNLHIAANYIGGVALNDCILNAKIAAQKLNI